MASQDVQTNKCTTAVLQFVLLVYLLGHVWCCHLNRNWSFSAYQNYPGIHVLRQPFIWKQGEVPHDPCQDDTAIVSHRIYMRFARFVCVGSLPTETHAYSGAFGNMHRSATTSCWRRWLDWSGDWRSSRGTCAMLEPTARCYRCETEYPAPIQNVYAICWEAMWLLLLFTGSITVLTELVSAPDRL